MRFLILLITLPALLSAQAPDALKTERAEYADWLATAPNSPYAAVARTAIGQGVMLGPETSDIPLEGVAALQVTEDGRTVRLKGAGTDRLLPRDRRVPVVGYQFMVSGEPGRTLLTVYGPPGEPETPEYYAWSGNLIYTGPLVPADEPVRHRILTLDGLEVEATEAGEVRVPVGDSVYRLKVYRVPVPGTGERELTIYFRDATSGAGSYPAGRFVTLDPAGGGRYRLDFNRARNPFCAYSSVYACPAPWPGNTLPHPVLAGEKYEGHDS
ncbi:MAG: DUF1684 domain-containing protein [Gemmatimonadales bacterium]